MNSSCEEKTGTCDSTFFSILKNIIKIIHAFNQLNDLMKMFVLLEINLY